MISWGYLSAGVELQARAAGVVDATGTFRASVSFNDSFGSGARTVVYPTP